MALHHFEAGVLISKLYSAVNFFVNLFGMENIEYGGSARYVDQYNIENNTIEQ